MSNISSFYNNLLTIQVTVFGVLTAVVFVFIQIAYTNFSHRQVDLLIRNFLLLAYFVVSGLTLTLTAAGSLLLSFEQHDFIPYWDLRSQSILSNPLTALILLILTFVSVALFLFLVFRNLRYLQPHSILLLESEAMQPRQLKLFLYKKYGVPSLRYFSKPAFAMSDDALRELLPFLGSEAKELSSAEKEALKEKANAEEKKLKTDQQLFDELKTEAEQATDPFEVISDIATRAINNCDLRALDTVRNAVMRVTDKFIKSLKRTPEHGWDPEANLPGHFADHAVSVLEALIEIAGKQGLESARIKALEASKDIVFLLYDAACFPALTKILTFWKLMADKAIGSSKETFNYIVGQYDELATLAFKECNKDGREEAKNVLDETFRHLGWLGERLLPKKGFEDKPLMSDMSYQTEYDHLLNTLLSFSSKYNTEGRDQYPLIYFDAIYVMVRQLAALRIKNRDSVDLKHHLFSCFQVFSAFAEQAIASGNNNGAALASLRLKTCYEVLLGDGLEDSAEEAIRLLVTIGTSAAAQKEKLKQVSFLDKLLDEYVMKILVDSPFTGAISGEVRESLIKSMGDDHKKVWSFITALGKRMRTNFGFMFDWSTGELYSDDDPRRH